MAKQYQGRTVTVTRDARKGDPGFDENKKDQILIDDNGTQRVVDRAAVTEQAK